MDERLRIEVSDGIATVMIDRPEAMNALDRALRLALASAVARLEADPSVRVLVLTGAGDRAFCAGLDLKELAADAAAIADTVATGPDANPCRAIEQCAKPVIGAINGVAVTGGFELALACDILIASDRAQFADTHARVGIMPGWGLSQKLSRRIGISRAKELSLSGNFLDAKTAERWGLVNRVVAPDALLPAARALAADIASVDAGFVAAYKRLIDDGFLLPLGEALQRETDRAREANAGVTPAAVAARRAEVLARGRSQAG